MEGGQHTLQGYLRLAATELTRSEAMLLDPAAAAFQTVAKSSQPAIERSCAIPFLTRKHGIREDEGIASSVDFRSRCPDEWLPAERRG